MADDSDDLIRAADYRDLVRVGDPRLHPDGDRVAFVRNVPESDEEYEATVYLVDTDGEGDPAGSRSQRASTPNRDSRPLATVWRSSPRAATTTGRSCG